MSKIEAGNLNKSELITLSDCDEIIGKAGENLEKAKVIDFALVKIGGDLLGFLGDYFNLTINVQSENKDLKEYRFFVKTLPFSEKEQCEMMEQFGIFRKETQLYSYLFPEINGNAGASKWRPDCYLVKNYLIVLEDLKQLNYVHTTPRTPYSKQHIEVTLQALSRMHSACFNYERKDTENSIKIRNLSKEYLYETTVTPDCDWFLTGLRTIVAVALQASKYGVGSTHEHLVRKELYNRMTRIFQLIEKPSNEFANVICHRDLWCNNMMFKNKSDNPGEPENCVLLDFQICRYLPPAIDVLLAVHLNSRRAHREEYFSHYLSYYYACLKEELLKFNISVADALEWNAFKNSINHYKIIPLIFNSIYTQLTHLPVGLLDNMRLHNLDKYNQFCSVNRDDVVLGALSTDDYFRVHLVEAVEELVEYLFQNEMTN